MAPTTSRSSTMATRSPPKSPSRCVAAQRRARTRRLLTIASLLPPAPQSGRIWDCPGRHLGHQGPRLHGIAVPGDPVPGSPLLAPTATAHGYQSARDPGPAGTFSKGWAGPAASPAVEDGRTNSMGGPVSELLGTRLKLTTCTWLGGRTRPRDPRSAVHHSAAGRHERAALARSAAEEDLGQGQKGQGDPGGQRRRGRGRRHSAYARLEGGSQPQGLNTCMLRWLAPTWRCLATRSFVGC